MRKFDTIDLDEANLAREFFEIIVFLANETQQADYEYGKILSAYPSDNGCLTDTNYRNILYGVKEGLKDLTLSINQRLVQATHIRRPLYINEVGNYCLGYGLVMMRNDFENIRELIRLTKKFRKLSNKTYDTMWRAAINSFPMKGNERLHLRVNSKFSRCCNSMSELLNVPAGCFAQIALSLTMVQTPCSYIRQDHRDEMIQTIGQSSDWAENQAGLTTDLINMLKAKAKREGRKQKRYTLQDVQKRIKRLEPPKKA